MVRKKIYCRFEGCKHKGFTSRAGRLYHERTKHGRAFTDKETQKEMPNTFSPVPESTPKLEQSHHDTFVKITDVKFDMAKNTRKPKDGDSGEKENECGKCGHEFNGASKFCPECGVEFASE